MWIVAKIETKKADFVAESIARQGHEYYLPKYLEGSKTKFLFPGYIFCRVETSWRFLTGTFGVISVISFGERPGIVADAVIEAIRVQEGADGLVVLPENPNVPRLKKGQRIRLRNGPFLGYIGLYDGQTARDRERVLLELMGRRIVVRVNRDDIEVEG